MRIGKKIVGTFHSEQDVLNAIEGLKRQGYRETDMMVVTKNYSDIAQVTGRTGVMAEADAQVSSLAGAMVDSFFTMMTAGMGGSQARTLTDRLIERGLPEFTAKQCEAEVNNGRMILLVDTNETSGHSIYEQLSNSAYTGEEQKAIRLREEQLDIVKERVQIGELQLRKEVVEEQRTIHVPIMREEIYVERRPVIDGMYDGSPAMEDEIIRIPVMEERIEITKRPVVVEEIIIGKRRVEEVKKVEDIIRKEEVHIERSTVPVIEETAGQAVVDLPSAQQEGTIAETLKVSGEEKKPNIASVTTEDKKEEPRAKRTGSVAVPEEKKGTDYTNKSEINSAADSTGSNDKDKTDPKSELVPSNNEEGKNNKTQINKKKS